MRKLPIFFILAAAALIILVSIKIKGESNQVSECRDCNVILITLTNLRWDHLSQNGYDRPTTPNLDALAKQSLVFENMFSHSSWTLPEGISIFTSLYPFQHGVMNRFDGSFVSKDTPSLIDMLNKSGYKTAGFTGGFDYDPKYGLTSRFDDYEGCGDESVAILTTLGYGKLDCTLPKALTWIKNNVNSKFFVHIQGYDVHCPFSQKGGATYDKNYRGNVDFTNCLWTFDKTDPVIKDGKKFYPVYSSGSGSDSKVLLSEEDVHHLIAIYDEAIKDSDTQLGDFLNQIGSMGLNKKTIIIFTSEHGDMFGKYGRFMRGGPLRGTFYDDVLHVPFIMKIPGVASKHLSQLAEQIDIMPTLLDFLGIPKPGGLEGKTLMPVVTNGKEIHQYVFAGSVFSPENNNIYFKDTTRIEAVRSKDWKLIEETNLTQKPQKTTYEMYDLTKDKEELHNLYNGDSPIFKTLNDELQNWTAKFFKSN